MLIEYCRSFKKKVHFLIIFPISHSDQELLCPSSGFRAASSTCYSLSSMILTSYSRLHSLETCVSFYIFEKNKQSLFWILCPLWVVSALLCHSETLQRKYPCSLPPLSTSQPYSCPCASFAALPDYLVKATLPSVELWVLILLNLS